MGIRSKIQTAVAKAFDTSLADAVRSLILEQSITTFNSATNIATEATTQYTTRGVVGSYIKKTINDIQVEPNDVKVVMLQNEVAVTPKIDDHIYDDTDKYTIINVRRDPAMAAWVIQCRK